MQLLAMCPLSPSTPPFPTPPLSEAKLIWFYGLNVGPRLISG